MPLETNEPYDTSSPPDTADMPDPVNGSASGCETADLDSEDNADSADSPHTPADNELPDPDGNDREDANIQDSAVTARADADTPDPDSEGADAGDSANGSDQELAGTDLPNPDGHGDDHPAPHTSTTPGSDGMQTADLDAEGISHHGDDAESHSAYTDGTENASAEQLLSEVDSEQDPGVNPEHEVECEPYPAAVQSSRTDTSNTDDQDVDRQSGTEHQDREGEREAWPDTDPTDRQADHDQLAQDDISEFDAGRDVNREDIEVTVGAAIQDANPNTPDTLHNGLEDEPGIDRKEEVPAEAALAADLGVLPNDENERADSLVSDDPGQQIHDPDWSEPKVRGGIGGSDAASSFAETVEKVTKDGQVGTSDLAGETDGGATSQAVAAVGDIADVVAEGIEAIGATAPGVVAAAEAIRNVDVHIAHLIGIADAAQEKVTDLIEDIRDRIRD